MARRAVVLEITGNDESLIFYRLLMWVPVPEDQRVPLPDFESAYPSDLPNQPTGAELNALRSGAWVEKEVNLGVDKRDNQGRLRNENQLWQAFRDAASAYYNNLATSQEALKISPVIYGTTFDDQTGWNLVLTR